MRLKELVVLLLVMPLSLFSQSRDDSITVEQFSNLSLEELMNVKVYGAARTHGQSSVTAPATVEVITREQIVSRGYRSLLDVLYDMPDIKIDYGVDPRWMNDITIRGIRYMDKFQILLNGVKISPPTNDLISVMENYPVHFAKQVEIIYGPASALYGADAFSGVINIITDQNISEAETRVTAEGGMYNLINGNFYTQDDLGEDFSFSIGGQFFYDEQPDLARFYPDLYQGMDEELQSGTFNTINGPITPETPVEPHKSHALMAYGLFAGFDYNGLKLNYFGNYGRNPSTMANSPHNSVYNHEQFFGHSVNMVNLSYEKQFDSFKSISDVTYSRYNLDSRSNFRNLYSNMEPAYLFAYGWMTKAEQLISYDMSDRFKLTAGLSFAHYVSMPRSNNLEYPVFGNDPGGIIVNSEYDFLLPDGIPANLIQTKYNSVGGLAQAHYEFDFPLTITAGARIDNDERYGTSLNPRLGLVYEEKEDFTMKALYGTAYLAPSPQYMYDRYGTLVPTNDSSTYYAEFMQLPNENLKPQKVQTVEISFLKYFNDELSVRATGYTSFVSGLISPVVNNETVESIYPDHLYPGTQYHINAIQINDNLGESTIYGGNIIIDYKQIISSVMSHRYALSYSYIEGYTDIDESGPTEERNLPGISNHTVKFRGTFKWGGLTVSPALIWMSDQRAINAASVQSADVTKYQTIPGFVLVNAHVNYDITKKLAVFLSGHNLLDERYRNVNIGAAPESMGAGSAAVEFAGGAPQNPFRISAGFRISL